MKFPSAPRIPLAALLLPVLLLLSGCGGCGERKADEAAAADAIAKRSRLMIEWMADEYVPPYPDFSDAEKYYFPRALARMMVYGEDDPPSNFGDASGGAFRPPEIQGILDFRGRPPTEDGGEGLPGFVDKKPFHFILLGMSRLLFEFPEAPALAANRHAYLDAALRRTDNYNAFTAEGTENHVNMSRTAGYIYACEAAREPARYPGAAALVGEMRDWLLAWSRWLYRSGDGEWNSVIYTAYNMAGWFNVFDYTAPGARGEDAEVHAAARAVLDYYAAQLALHYSWGLVGGAEMRGHGSAEDYAGATGATDFINWLWFAGEDAAPPGGFNGTVIGAIYAAFSGYRPPAAVLALAREKHDRPGTYHIASPGYLMVRLGETLRTFEVGRHFTLGSASMPVGGWVSSTVQVVNWKLLAEDPAGGLPRLVWGNGGYRGNNTGNVRNPWDQFAQHGGVLVQMTRVPEDAEAIVEDIRRMVKLWRADWNKDFLERWPEPDRGGFKGGFGSIHFLPGNLAVAPRNRIFFPRSAPLERAGGVVFIDLDPVFLAVRSLFREEPAQPMPGMLEDVAPRGRVSGLLMEVGERGAFDGPAAFKAAVLERTGLERVDPEEGRFAYRNLKGERIQVRYAVEGSFNEPGYDMVYGVTEPVAFIQGADWRQPDWPEGEGHGRVPFLLVDGERIFPRAGLPHVDGPLLHHEDSVMRVSAGGPVYEVDYAGERPVFPGD